MRLILLAVTLHLVHAKNLQIPSYFKVCARSDPNFGECLLKRGREIMPHLMKGERMFNLPPLDPFEMKELKLSDGQGRGQLNLTMRDIKVLGLKDAYLQNFTHDLNTGHTTLLLTMPQLTVLGTYNISEYILMLPISGTGNINITLVDKKCTIRYYILTEKINGVDHALLTSPAVHLDPKRMYIHLDNLFDGDKRLGDEMHKLLDENWKEVFYEITPHIAALIIEVLTGIINGINKQIPYDLLAPETLS